jgi:hypothetical protein
MAPDLILPTIKCGLEAVSAGVKAVAVFKMNTHCNPVLRLRMEFYLHFLRRAEWIPESFWT